ncbi:M61 family metallopeptidase [Telmatocola sphagniphila]|uniref:M61 family metallopeptidase n=1 Tax=Telmatocola sphagniphila TaxID=1123043 RepID=A0A8E6ES23_9BACT|nr:PDZ domain-containing protein [Telmatocola sphagniphila]QVL30034.1 M61 family metallopeptidase [Telmatocola sphagniphila]
MSHFPRRYGYALLAVLCCYVPLRAADTPMEIHVDLTQAPRKLFQAKLVIPVKPGPLTLHYPKWIQGEHQPSGPVNDLSGLKITAEGKSIPWTRDDVELHSFHCEVPKGVSTLNVSIEYLAPGDKGGYGSGPASTAKLAIFNWYLLTLYTKEKGQHVRDISVRGSVKLPEGWKAGTALPIESQKGSTIQFKTVSLEKLIDSPVLCGLHFKEIPIGPKEGPPHFLDLACDSAAGLEIDDKWIAAYSKLVAEAGSLFGASHYETYHFLVSLTDQFGHNAIEHHECSDNRLAERAYIDESQRKLETAWVLSHEYVHSWNGKFRRPEGLSTPDYQEPMKTKLLWMYEGMTEYYGFVLAARSGLWPQDIARDNWAELAEWARHQTGRDWRPLEDTATSGPFLYSSRGEWSRRRRSVDFYDEGALMWLDADTLIREKSGGKKSLDDFCKAFHGGGNGKPEVKPYTFEEIVSTLNGVVEYDWKDFLEKRVRLTAPQPPLDGITRGGWKVVNKSERNELRKATEEESKSVNLGSSIGLIVSEEGKIADVVADSPADKVGLGPHMKIYAVNGRKFTNERLVDAVAATLGGKEKVELLVENGEFVKSYSLGYTGGLLFPHLVREASKPDLIGEILKPTIKK